MRLVGADGSQIGIVEVADALQRARDLDLDLVEVAPQANPPVCRIMDYGKYKYERDIRQKEARKKQSRIDVKEIKFRPKIDPHDYATKKGHVERFLKAGQRVKVTIMFRPSSRAYASTFAFGPSFSMTASRIFEPSSGWAISRPRNCSVTFTL